MGQKRKSARLRGMSALPSTTDIASLTGHVGKVPLDDMHAAFEMKEAANRGGLWHHGARSFAHI
jgi:hypothetical protein